MDAFLLFFEQIPTWQKVVWVMICLGLSWVLEGMFPLVRLSHRKWRHGIVNGAFLATSFAINALFGVATLAASVWTEANHFGFLHLVELRVWAELLLALIALDLTAQCWAHYGDLVHLRHARQHRPAAVARCLTQPRVRAHSSR